MVYFLKVPAEDRETYGSTIDLLCNSILKYTLKTAENTPGLERQNQSLPVSGITLV